MGGLEVPIRIGVLASGGGSNMQAIIDRCEDGTLPAEVVCVISNNSTSGAMERAAKHGIAAYHMSSVTHPDPGALDTAMCEAMRKHGVGLVALCGYMKKIGPRMLKAFEPYILNIHPALLPKFGGKGMYGIHVHEAVLAAGETESGVTVHLVNAQYDTGPIVAQRRAPVVPGDTPESLQQRVLAVEHAIYADVILALAEGRLDVSSGEPSEVLQ